MSDKPKAPNFKSLLKSFWALSRPKQEAFLKGLYELSPENKDLFRLWVGNDKEIVFNDLKKEIQKETIARIPRFRKLRLSKINLILRNADKYALPMQQQIELRKEAWMGMAAFIISKGYLPDRYQIATARHLDQYLMMVKHHILETSEVEDRLAKDRELLEQMFHSHFGLSRLEDVYMEHFHSP